MQRTGSSTTPAAGNATGRSFTGGNENALNNTVQTYYVAEMDKVRSNSKSDISLPLKKVPSAKNRFKAIVQSAMGSVKINKGGNELYFSAPDCVKVRRRLGVNGLVEMQTEDYEGIFKRTMAPFIERAFTDKRDVVFALGGHQGTTKNLILHGETTGPSESGDTMPDRSKWGTVCFAVEQLLALAKTSPEQCEITTTVTKIQHDHVADVMVSLSGLRLTKKDSQKTRQQYAKLLTVSQGVTLDVEEGMDGRFGVSDQLDCAVKTMDDFLHVINCCAAANTGKFVMNSLINKKASPSHYLISIRVWRKDVTPIFVHFLEMADFDWTGPDEDTEAFRSVVNSVAEIGSALSKGDFLRVKSKVRENTLTRILFSSLNFNHSDFVYYGLSKFTHGMDTLDYMARISNRSIEIVLHGPDGEGDNDVDPELKEHVHHIQQQCDDLKSEVESLSEERKQLKDRLQNGEESISRLQQQCSIVKKLASMSSAAKHDPGNTPSALSGGSSGGSQAAVLTPAQEQQRRLLNLERDVAELRAEDKRRTDSSLAQIKHINTEMHRCANRTTALKKEHADLTDQLATLQSNIKEEQLMTEQNMSQQLQSVIDHNHDDLERRNEEARKSAEQAFKTSQMREQREFIKEGEITKQLQDAASSLSDNIAKENAAWRDEHHELQKQLESSMQRRLDLETELLNVKRRHHLKIAQLDEESKEMTDYAHRVTKALVQFEHYNSTEAKKVIDFERCNVVLYDIMAKHDVPWFQKQCANMRAWLDSRHYPRPAAFVDVANNKCIILPTTDGGRGRTTTGRTIVQEQGVGRQKSNNNGPAQATTTILQPSPSNNRPTTAGIQRPTTAGRSRPLPSGSTPAAKAEETEKGKPDHAASMLQHLERRNNDLSIVLQSRQRLAALEAEKQKKNVRATRPGTANT